MTLKFAYFYLDINNLDIYDYINCNENYSIRQFLDSVEQLINRRYYSYIRHHGDDEEINFKDIHCVYLKGKKIEENSTLKKCLDDLENAPIFITDDPTKIIENYLPLINLNDYDDFRYYSFDYYYNLTANDKKTNKKVLISIINIDSKIDFRELIKYRIGSTLNHCGVTKILGFRYPLTEKEKKKTNVIKFICDPNSNPKAKIKEIDLTKFIIVFEFVQNGKLKPIVYNYLESKGEQHDKMNPTIRSKIVYGVASSMKYIHQKGAVHRYLCNRSILCDENFEPKIFNFKFLVPCKTIIDVDKDYYTDPIIMAPETFNDSVDEYDFSSDVYSYGFFLYRFFTNIIRFDDNKEIRNPQRYMVKINKGFRPKKPENIPDSYWDLIQRCWKQDPKERPTFDEIVEELKSDRYAINEYGMKTNIDELHEYQERIDSFEFNNSQSSNLKVENDQNEAESWIFMKIKLFLLNNTFYKK